MQKNKIQLSIILGAVTSALTACGGSSSTPSNQTPTNQTPSADNGYVVLGQPAVSGTFSFFGYVDIIIDNLEQTVDRDSNFFAMVEPQNTNTFFTIPPAVGQCRLRITDTIPTDSSTIGFPTEPFTLASAGETMTLTSSAGTYATVDFSESRFEFAPFPAPDDLSLSLPGMEFPAFSNVDIPPLLLPTNFQLSTGNELRVGTIFTWDEAGSQDSTLYLRMDAFSANSKVVGLECRMTDSGTYQLPAQVENALVTALGPDFALEGAAIERKAVNIVTQGDALLVVSRRSDF